MTNPRAINDVLEQLASLEGNPVEIEGVLSAEPEGYQLLHYPKAQRMTPFAVGDDTYEPAVWIAPGNGSIRLNTSALDRWVGKRVRVHGVLKSYHSLEPVGTFGRGGFGPSGFWPAQIEPYSVQRVSAEERRDHAV
jgi:hypothetical protein